MLIAVFKVARPNGSCQGFAGSPGPLVSPAGTGPKVSMRVKKSPPEPAML